MTYIPLSLAENINYLEIMSEDLSTLEGIDLNEFENEYNSNSINLVSKELFESIKSINNNQSLVISNLYDLAEQDLNKNIENYVSNVNNQLEKDEFPFSNWINNYSITKQKIKLKISTIKTILDSINNQHLALKNLSTFWFLLGNNTKNTISDSISDIINLKPLLNKDLDQIFSSANKQELIKNLIQPNINTEYIPTEFNFAYLTHLLKVNDFEKIKINKCWKILNNDELIQDLFFKFLFNNLGSQNDWSFILNNDTHRITKIKWDNVFKLASIINNDQFFIKLKKYLVLSMPYSTKTDENKINELNTYRNYSKLKRIIPLNKFNKKSSIKI